MGSFFSEDDDDSLSYWNDDTFEVCCFYDSC